MSTYVELKDVHSDVEPKEETKYGTNGVDYCINIRPCENGGFIFDILRFAREDDYIRYRKING